EFCPYLSIPGADESAWLPTAFRGLPAGTDEPARLPTAGLGPHIPTTADLLARYLPTAPGARELSRPATTEFSASRWLSASAGAVRRSTVMAEHDTAARETKEIE